MVSTSYEFPQTLSAVLFQISETVNIDRVTFLLDKIGET
jgi:hypothetical protein